MKKINIQKHLLILHLGLRGISEDLLETFPVDNLIDKSDSDACVVFYFSYGEKAEIEPQELKNHIAKILHVDIESIEKSAKEDCDYETHVFYNSHSLHWSETASDNFETLCKVLNPFDVRISLNASLNN